MRKKRRCSIQRVRDPVRYRRAACKIAPRAANGIPAARSIVDRRYRAASPPPLRRSGEQTEISFVHRERSGQHARLGRGRESHATRLARGGKSRRGRRRGSGRGRRRMRRKQRKDTAASRRGLDPGQRTVSRLSLDFLHSTLQCTNSPAELLSSWE